MSSINADLNQGQIDALLNEFDTKLNNLRLAYDRYFNGADRRPPVQLRQDVVRQMHQLEHKTFIQNTAQRFRLRSLVQRWSTHKIYWDRVLRQIEEGTYKRHVEKAKRNVAKRERFEQRRAEEEAQQQFHELDLDFDAVDGLDAFADELNQMAQQGQFDGYNRPKQPAQQPAQPSAMPTSSTAINQPNQPQQAQSLEARRAQKIAELQRKLGIEQQQQAQQAQPVQQQPAQSLAQNKEAQRRKKLEEMKRRLESRGQGNQPTRSGSTTAASQQKAPIRASQQRAQSTRQQPTASRGQEQVERVYRNLVEAKRRCNEPTNTLTRDAVARSMQQQRARFKQSHGADNVDFKVVIKNGKAFLKPEPK